VCTNSKITGGVGGDNTIRRYKKFLKRIELYTPRQIQSKLAINSALMKAKVKVKAAADILQPVLSDDMTTTDIMPDATNMTTTANVNTDVNSNDTTTGITPAVDVMVHAEEGGKEDQKTLGHLSLLSPPIPPSPPLSPLSEEAKAESDSELDPVSTKEDDVTTTSDDVVEEESDDLTRTVDRSLVSTSKVANNPMTTLTKISSPSTTTTTQDTINNRSF
jgi:hypothetical protein